MHLVAFDLETTGLDTATARVVEFCFVELDPGPGLGELSRWSELVHPGMAVPAETVRVHGIDDAMLAGRPAFAHFAPRVQALVQDAVLVAHNHRFDLEILSRELMRAGQPGLRPNHPCIDTQRVESFVNSHSLAETFRRYNEGQPFSGGHRSEADTLACVEVLRRQRARHAGRLPAALDGLVVASLERLARPECLRKDWLDHGRRFYADPAGTIRFAFGRYRDCPALQEHDCGRDGATRRALHRAYLTWMRDKSEFPPDVKALVASWIGAPPARTPYLAPSVPAA